MRLRTWLRVSFTAAETLEIKRSRPDQYSLEDPAGQQHLKSTQCSELKKVLQHQQEHGNQVSAERRPAGGATYAPGGILAIRSCPRT